MGYFRELKAEEIDCRVSTVTGKGCSLLLYKDARVDQNMLDEKFGIFGWERKHEIIGGNLYCTVSVFDKDADRWVSKQDVGTESYTEKEKGQASDAFKRACFNLGIGRELYTAPFIWVSSDKCTITPKDSKYTTYDAFKVTHIAYKDGNISELTIVNTKRGNEVAYQLREAPTKAEPKKNTSETKKADTEPSTKPQSNIAEAEAKTKVIAYINRHNYDAEWVARFCKSYHIESVNQLTLQQAQHYITFIRNQGGNIDE